MIDPGGQFDGGRILFWPVRDSSLRRLVEAKVNNPLARALLGPVADDIEAAIARVAAKPQFGLQCEPGQPLEFVRGDVPDVDRADLAKALAAGRVGSRYFGHANCLICGVELGSGDLHGFGFIWPEKSDHYVTRHNVWTPGCARLLAVLRRP